MKRKIPALVLAALLSAPTLGVSLTACTLFRKTEQTRATTTLQKVQDDYLEAGKLTKITEETLNELRVSPAVDLQKAYAVFVKKAQMMEETGSRLVTHADEMRYSGASYLVKPGPSPTASVPARTKAPERLRRDDYGPHFQAISEGAWEVKRAYRSFQLDVEQIRSSLWRNVTPKSVDSTNAVMDKARIDAESLRYALDDTLAAIERAKTAKAGNSTAVPRTP